MSRRETSASNSEERRRHYVPVRRVAQACINCRRKKIRCTGERPECSNCQRLFQQCSYAPSTSHSSEMAAVAGPTQENSHQMMERINHLEQCLGRVEDKLDRLLSMPGGPLLNGNSIPSPNDTCDMTTSNAPPVIFPEIEHDPYLWSLFSSSTPPAMLHSLPPLEEQLALIENYFNYYHNQPYSFFNEREFRRRFSTGQIPTHLLFAVIATPARFAANYSLDPKHKGMASRFADSAWQAIITDCFLGTGTVDIVTVQTLTLLSIFDFTAGKQRHKSAWVKIGIAVRLAQDLHLMDEADSTISFSEREERRRVFWSLYLLERLVSCGRARPPAITDASCSLRLPCDEESWESATEQHTPTLSVVRRRRLTDNETLSPFGMLIAAASLLSQCAQYMLQNQSIDPQDEPWHPRSHHAGLVSDLMHLESQIKVNQPIEAALEELCYTEGILNQRIASTLVLSRLLLYLCQCLVFHPFLLRELMIPSRIIVPKPFWNHAKETCRSASDDMIDLFRRAKEAGCMLVTSFGGYCLTVAATIQALQATVEVPESASPPPSLVRFQQCLAGIDSLRKYWSNAVVMSSKLEELTAHAHRFSFLMDGDSLGSPLEGDEREFLWSMLDYSTISKDAPDFLAAGISNRSVMFDAVPGFS